MRTEFSQQTSAPISCKTLFKQRSLKSERDAPWQDFVELRKTYLLPTAERLHHANVLENAQHKWQAEGIKSNSIDLISR